MKANGGALVTSVTQTSCVEKYFEVGDRIVTLNGNHVTKLKDLDEGRNETRRFGIVRDDKAVTDARMARTIHHIPASELGSYRLPFSDKQVLRMDDITSLFNRCIVGETPAKKQLMYANSAYQPEKIPSTTYSTHFFLDERRSSPAQRLPTLEDRVHDVDRRNFSSFSRENGLLMIRDDTVHSSSVHAIPQTNC